jgi:hypothetical protein
MFLCRLETSTATVPTQFLYRYYVQQLQILRLPQQHQSMVRSSSYSGMHLLLMGIRLLAFKSLSEKVAQLHLIFNSQQSVMDLQVWSSKIEYAM